MSPRISCGSERMTDVLVYLSTSEAAELQLALGRRLEKREGFRGPAYHLHITDDDGNELTVGVLDDDA
jgi:hypothetical protein